MTIAIVIVSALASKQSAFASGLEDGGVTCYSVYQGTWIGGSTIYRCIPNAPCYTVRAKEFSMLGTCP